MKEQKYIQTIFTEKAPQPGDYSQAKKIFVGTGWLVYTSAIGPDFTAEEQKTGQVKNRQDEAERLGGYIKPYDMPEQTKKALTNLEAVLSEAGAELTHIVKINALLSQGNYARIDNMFSEFAQAYNNYFESKGITENLPARAPTLVKELPWPGYLLLLDAVAFIPNTELGKTLKKLDEIQGKKQTMVD